MHNSQSNRQAFKELIITMAERERRFILFTGAGVSCQAGYPTWNQLMQRFHEAVTQRAEQCTNPSIPPEDDTGEMRDPGLGKAAKYIIKMTDPLWQAEAYLRELPDTEFYRLLSNEFGPRNAPEPELYGILREFNFNHVLTTNFDPSLEQALAKVTGRPLTSIEWTDRRKVRRLLRLLNEERPERFYVYLHGVYNQPETVVLTESQFRNRYILSDDANKKLLALLMTQTILFLGFSVNDPQFQFLFRTLSAHLGPGTPSHFILLKASSEEDENLATQAMFDKKYSLQTIFYADTPKHADLFVTMQQLWDSLAQIKRLAEPRLSNGTSEPRDVYEQIVEKDITDARWEKIWGIQPLPIPSPTGAVSPVTLPAQPAAAGPAPRPAAIIPPQKPLHPDVASTALGMTREELLRAAAPVSPMNPLDPEDPNKGQFGGKSEVAPYRLEASVVRTDDPDWFDIKMKVTAAPPPDQPKKVIFYLHPTFRRAKVGVEMKNGEAMLERTAYGAFTVGVEIEGTGVRLELDLSDLPGAPARFRSR